MKLIGKIYYWIRDTIRHLNCNHENVLVYEFRMGDYIEQRYRCRKCGYNYTVKVGKPWSKWR